MKGINTMAKKILFILTAFLVGCINANQPIVETTKPWENHYYTVEEFQNGTKDISLDNGESIWVISNRTLSRVLKK